METKYDVFSWVKDTSEIFIFILLFWQNTKFSGTGIVIFIVREGTSTIIKRAAKLKTPNSKQSIPTERTTSACILEFLAAPVRLLVIKLPVTLEVPKINRTLANWTLFNVGPKTITSQIQYINFRWIIVCLICLKISIWIFEFQGIVNSTTLPVYSVRF